MDDGTLQPLLNELDTHQCWLKPIGWSGHPIDEQVDFSQSVIRLDFARPSKQLKMDDFIFVYAVGHRKLCFIGRCNTPVQEASVTDIVERPERARWGYWVKAINKTQVLGRDWAQQNVRLFDLVESHNQQYPSHAFKVGSLNYGSDLLRVPATFARMVIDELLKD